MLDNSNKKKKKERKKRKYKYKYKYKCHKVFTVGVVDDMYVVIWRQMI